ncbi:MAG: FAD-dependent oxidoreductase [Ruminococcaceae bacterium]|nr:FAD-dependent oxidoreductase [Oscillospiraceae bacterium]
MNRYIIRVVLYIASVTIYLILNDIINLIFKSPEIWALFYLTIFLNLMECLSHTTYGDSMSIQKPLWSSTVNIKPHDKLLKDIECDVLVIGGGLSGVLTAYFLAQNNVDVVIVEASSVCSGQTAKTTAKITSQHGVCYSEIEKKFSSDVARLYANANEKAIDDFDKLIFDNHIDCDFVRLPSYLYSEKSIDKIQKEFDFTHKCAINAVLTKRTELPFDVKLALRYQNQAQFNPFPFIKNLSSHISIFENTRVLRVEDNIAYCDIAKVKAKNIVFATHYPIINFPGLYFMRMHQSRSYVVALKNAPNLKAMYYCVDKGGLSFRSFKDYILMSGSSHRTGEEPLHTDPYKYLYEQAKSFYPDAELCYSFSAQDCMSPDYLPYAGHYSKSKKDWYVMTGFSKWGMTNSMISAKLVYDMILGNKNELKTILSPSRFNMSTVKPVLNETGHAIKSLSKTLLRIPIDSVTDVKRGEAKVVMYKGKRCGVYRTEDDKLYAVLARCPHLGCALSFNKAEKTWDCPCHGSRFSYKGELIDSPAQTSLKRYE